MLPTDSAKRILLQQHLLTSYQERQRRLNQLANNVRSLQQPLTSPMLATTPSVHQPLSALMAGFAAGNNHSACNRSSNRFAVSEASNIATADCSQPSATSSNVLLSMIAAEQERGLKRRVSEMQQAKHQHQSLFQRVKQTSSHAPHFPSTNRTVARYPASEISVPPGEMMLKNVSSNLKPLFDPTTAGNSLFAAASSSGPTAAALEAREEVRPTKRAKVKNTFKEEREGTTTSEEVAQERPPSSSTRKDSRWMQSFEMLKEYKKETGNCTVPRGYATNPRLASWVAEQRKQYKLMIDGRQSSITPERVALLNDVGFAWNAQEAAWQRHMEDLKNFMAEHGVSVVFVSLLFRINVRSCSNSLSFFVLHQQHCNCPLNYPTYPKLGLWIKEQRRHYTLMKQGKQTHMTEARSAELDAIGFCWDTHENTWMERLNDLKLFREKYGHCICPTNYAHNPKLGTWIHHQRRQWKKFQEGKPCHITTERIKALDSLGFVWQPRAEKSSTNTNNASILAPVDQTEASEQQNRVPEDDSPADLNKLDLRPSKRIQK